MALLLLFFIAGLGAVIGSFLNVVILRYNTGRSLSGRSACFSCKTVLRWYELIPVGSYLLQRGRCRTCNSKIASQYPLVELLTALLLVLLHLKFYAGALTPTYLMQFGVYALITSLLIVILVYDIRHKIIPNIFVYPAALLAFLTLFVDFEALSFTIPQLWDALAGLFLALPFALLWLFSGGKWMGLGDAKLALVLGWVLGITAGFTAVLFAFWSGALISLLLLLLSRGATFQTGNSLLPYRLPLLTMKSEVPFAPFLILSFWFVFFSGFDLLANLRF